MEKFQPAMLKLVMVAYERWLFKRFQEVPTILISRGIISIGILEVVAYKRWSHREV